MSEVVYPGGSVQAATSGPAAESPPDPNPTKKEFGGLIRAWFSGKTGKAGVSNDQNTHLPPLRSGGVCAGQASNSGASAASVSDRPLAARQARARRSDTPSGTSSGRGPADLPQQDTRTLETEFERSRTRVQQDLVELGKPHSFQSLRPPVERIRGAIVEASGKAGTAISEQNRKQLFTTFWRVALKDDEAEKNILQQLQARNSAIRQLGEATTWVCERHEGVRPAQQTSQPAQRPQPPAQQTSQPAPRPQPSAQRSRGLPQAGPATNANAHSESLRAAKDYAAMISSLAQVLCEKHGRDLNDLQLQCPDVLPRESVRMLYGLGALSPPPKPHLDGRQQTDRASGPAFEESRKCIRQYLDACFTNAPGLEELQERIRNICDTESVTVESGPRDNRGAQQDLYSAIMSWCTNAQSKVNFRLLANLAFLMSRESLGDLTQAAFSIDRPETAILGGMPIVDGSSWSLLFRPDRFGSIGITTRLDSTVDSIRMGDGNGETVDSRLDPASSKVRTEVVSALDAETGEATVLNVSVTHTFSLPEQEPPGNSPTPARFSARECSRGAVTLEEDGSVIPILETRDEEPNSAMSTRGIPASTESIDNADPIELREFPPNQ